MEAVPAHVETAPSALDPVPAAALPEPLEDVPPITHPEIEPPPVDTRSEPVIPEAPVAAIAAEVEPQPEISVSQVNEISEPKIGELMPELSAPTDDQVVISASTGEIQVGSHQALIDEKPEEVVPPTRRVRPIKLSEPEPVQLPEPSPDQTLTDYTPEPLASAITDASPSPVSVSESEVVDATLPPIEVNVVIPLHDVVAAPAEAVQAPVEPVQAQPSTPPIPVAPSPTPTVPPQAAPAPGFFQRIVIKVKSFLRSLFG